MTMKVSLGGLNNKSSQNLRQEIEQTANAKIETMEEYSRLIRLVRESFTKKYGRLPHRTEEEL